MSNRCVPIHQTDRFIYLRSHTGIAGGDIRGKRKTVQVPTPLELKGKFDLDRYQAHVASCLGAGPSTLRDIPPLIDDLRLDLVWRFIAVIFLEHAGAVHVRQQGQAIWVTKHDDREGQDLLGEVKETDFIPKNMPGPII